MEKRCFIKFDSLMKDTLTNDNFKSEKKKKAKMKLIHLTRHQTDIDIFVIDG